MAQDTKVIMKLMKLKQDDNSVDKQHCIDEKRLKKQHRKLCNKQKYKKKFFNDDRFWKKRTECSYYN